MEGIHSKRDKLENILQDAQKVMVAFSAGVDSTLLLKTAHEVLGDQVVAVTAVSKAYPVREKEEAVEFCRENGIRQILIESGELSIEGFSQNPPNRCYLCKRDLFSKIKEIAEKEQIEHIMEGSNLDDDDDYRPGALALKELGIESPLKEAGLTKNEIRHLAKEAGLSVWNKPSMACLYSRFVYGEEITEEKLRMIEQAEELLTDMDFQHVRVRLHGSIARIEVGKADFPEIIKPKVAELVYQSLIDMGFQYVTLDLGGYRTGSMNKTLS